MRVLIVEDSEPVARIFALLLQRMSHEVEVADSGAKAIERIPEFGPDVIFSDISMPGISGYDLAQLIRRKPDCDHIFLVAMTGYSQPEDRESALQAGFDEHVVKPVDITWLQKLFETLTGRS